MILLSIVLNELLTLKIMDGIVQIASFIFAMSSVIFLLRTYKGKLNRLRVYLIILFIALGFAGIAQLIDGLFYLGWGTDNTFGLYSIQYGYALIILFTGLANIAILFFAFEVFFQEKETKYQILKHLLSVLIIFLSILGSILKISNLDVTIVIGIYFLVAMISYIILGTNAYRLAKKIDDKDYKHSIRYIGHFAFSLLAIYIFFILDSFSTTYTIWGFFGWAIFLVAIQLAYVGFVKPIKKSKGKNNGNE